jgi:Spy/CpxP family protein refolding chaperone
MKTSGKLISGIMLTILLSVLITVSFAQNPNRPHHTGNFNQEMAPSQQPGSPAIPSPPSPPMPPRVDHQAPPQLELPGLTNEQQEKIHQSDLDHMKKMTPLHNQVNEKKARLQTILTTSPFDAKAAEQIADELGKTGTEILKETIRHDQELRNLLTPLQQIIFDSRPKPFLRREM